MIGEKLKSGCIGAYYLYDIYDTDIKPIDIFCKSEIGEDFGGYAVVDHIYEYETKRKFQEYDVITGYGDKNSKVHIAIKLILKDYTLSEKYYYINPHKFYYWDNRFEDMIKTKSKEIKIIKKLMKTNNEYKREEKLERIVNGRI